MRKQEFHIDEDEDAIPQNFSGNMAKLQQDTKVI
jgi:hypothetical protein